MVFDLPFHHQNAHVSITFLVVDDDPVSLSMIQNMHITQTYKDKSYGGIKVLTAKNSSEAVSTLRGHCNNIDVVIIDYHIPGLNGIQLKQKIDEEFGNLLIFVISADHSKEIEQKVLACGAKRFLRKPISPDDLKTMWKFSRRSNRMMSDPGRSSNALHGKIPRKVTKKNRKPQLKWTSNLRNKFLQSINHIGVTKAKPLAILEYMKREGLTREQIASYLQKYRISLKSIQKQGDELQKAAKLKNPSFELPSDINSQDSYNNAGLISQLGFGLGQSSLMRNNNDSIPNIDKRSIYDTGSNFLPAGGRFGFTNGILPPMEGRLGVPSGMFPPMEGRLGVPSGMLPPMEGRLGVPSGMFPPMEGSLGYSSGTFGTSQAPQGPRFGQYGTTIDALGMNSNLSTGYMTNNYAGIRLNGNGDLLAPGRGRVNVNANGSLGGNLDAMNWTSYNNNMSNNHGSSNPMFPSAFPSVLNNEYHQAENNLAAQMDGVVPVLENPNIYNGPHHGINEVFDHGTFNSQNDQNQREGNVTGENVELISNYDVLEMNSVVPVLENPNMSNGPHHGINEVFDHGTVPVNSRYDQNQREGNVTGENVELISNYDVLEMNGVVPVLENPNMSNGPHHGINEVFDHGTVNSQYDQNQRQGNNMTGENVELPNYDLLDERNAILDDPYPFEDIRDRGFDNNLDYNVMLVNVKIADNSETYVPAGDVMNNMDQEQEDPEIKGLLSTFDQDWEARGAL